MAQRKWKDAIGQRRRVGLLVAGVVIVLASNAWGGESAFSAFHCTAGSVFGCRQWSGAGTDIGDGQIVFAADDGVHGEEPWVSDGTRDGTYLLADIGRGATGSVPGDVTSFGTHFYFTAWDFDRDTQAVWRSDGTPEGTLRVWTPPEPSTLRLRTAGERLYIAVEVSDGVTPPYLWTTDGTPEGGLVLNIRASLRAAMALGDTLLFFASGEEQNDLWATDGTVETTRLVKEGLHGGGCGSAPAGAVVGDVLLFFGRQETEEWGLWRSDGTPDGTVLVRNLELGRFCHTNDFAATADLLFFAAGAEFSDERELWVSDGTPSGTRPVDTTPAALGPQGFTTAPAAERVFFVAERNLFASDGTPEGTVRLSTEGGISFWDFGNSLSATEEDVFFTGAGALWVSDGTPDGSVPLTSIGDIVNLVAAGDRVFFGADDGVHGHELWVSDGTPEGTRLVRDIHAPPPITFRRGDCNSDGTPDIADAVFGLLSLFQGGPASECPEGCDSNDDSSLDVSDAVYLLNFLFLAGDPPPAPFPGCGVSPSGTSDLGCDLQACE